MALRSYADMSYSDDKLYDLSKGMGPDYEPPEFPYGLQFNVTPADLAKAGAEGGEPDDSMRFSAMGEVTSVYKGREHCRIEIRLDEFAGEDGKFFNLKAPASICFSEEELEKLDLEADCEIGDTIHLIGTARVESMSSSEFSESVVLQVTQLTCEDESDESRDG